MVFLKSHWRQVIIGEVGVGWALVQMLEFTSQWERWRKQNLSHLVEQEQARIQARMHDISKVFTAEVYKAHRARFVPRRKREVWPLRGGEWGGLCSLRELRG